MTDLSDFAHAIDDVVDAATHGRDPIDGLEDYDDDDALATVDPDYREPWTRQPDENAKAWERFRYYRDLDPAERSHAKVAEKFGVTKKAIEAQAGHYEWGPRIVAFDTHEDRLYQLRRQQAIRDMADRHSEQLVKALDALQLPFQALRRKLETDPTLLEDLSARDVKVLMNMAAQSARVMPNMLAAERLARGMPTELVEVQGEVNHVHTPDRDTISAIVGALNAAGAFDDRRAGLSAGEIVEGEVVEVHPDRGGRALTETDSLPPS